MKRQKIHYGWFVVAACCIVMGTAMGIVANCSSLFIKPISEDLNYSRSAVSFILSVFSAGNMVASLLAGKIFTEDNIVKVMKIAIIILVLAYFGYSLSTSLAVFYLLAAITSICETIVTVLPITFILNNWFYEKGGIALGLASMGSGIGAAIFNALAGRWITQFGWRYTFMILAAFVAVLAIPCIFFVIKLRPADMGLTPYGTAPNRSQHQNTKEDISVQTKKSPVFWALAVSAALIGVCMNVMYNSISPHLTDIGYSLTFSANLLSIGMVALAAGKLLLGRLFDRLGVKVTFFIACFSLFASLIGLLLSRHMLALPLIVLGIGLGSSFGAVCFPLTVPAVFGKKDYRSILGIISAIQAMGGAMAPTVAGFVFDQFGSYNPAFIVCAVIMAFITLLLWFVLPSQKAN